MYLRFGYACITKTLEITTSHTITYTNYKKLSLEQQHKKLIEISEKNLDNLLEIIKYNIKNNIHFYRMSSNIFPLATHPEIKIDILKICEKKLKTIGQIINENKLRVDIHLDPYCVLNSTNNSVVNSSINIINFYKNMLLKMDVKTNMVLHIGSNSFGKKKSITRFINNFKKLDEESKKLIILENDDKVFNIKDTLYICKKLNIPMVLDYHHYICNNEGENINDFIEEIFNTWKNKTPKVHISSSKNKKEYRTHHDYINITDFIKLKEIIKKTNRNVDIMIEAKEKDNALFKLTRQLKYMGYDFIDETTIKI